MKRAAKLLTLWLLSAAAGFAQQSKETGLDIKIKVFSEDRRDQLTLNAEAEPGEAAEGYILETKYDGLTEGKIQAGGFSFLRDRIFGSPVDMLRERWVKNGFPAKDLEGLTNGVNVRKVFSFSILTAVKDGKDDTASVFLKYAAYELRDDKEKKDTGETDLQYEVKLRYKLLRIAFGKEEAIELENGFFGKRKVTLVIQKQKEDQGTLTLTDENNLFGRVMAAAQSADLNQPEAGFSVEFLQADVHTRPAFNFRISDFFIHDRESNIKGFTSIKNGRTGETVKLPVPVYYAHLSFPFILHNKEKRGEYKSYSPGQGVFNSDYDVIIVPSGYERDTLTAEVFISCRKLNIDGLQRWTPIKKRLKIVRDYGVNIDMPKENWTAAFSENGESYQIYGYSDFERFVNEFIYINFE